MPPQAAIQILNYGHLLWQNSQRSASDREESKTKQAEEQLIALLYDDTSTTLRGVLNYSNNGKSIEPTVLRVLSLVAYTTLCSTRLGTTVAEIACGIRGDDPACVLEARRTISSLLLRRQLVLRDDHGDCVCLGKPMLAFFSGGADAPPLVPTEWSLREARRKTDLQSERRKTKSAAPLPTAKDLVAEIGKVVIGLDGQVKTLACRLALHLRRASMIRAGQDSGGTNECLLCIGPSGCGKTFLAESAGRISGIPFASVSSGDITAEGYVGLSIEHTIRPLIDATNGDVGRARFGMVFMDEWDKKAATTSISCRDIGGACVQQEMLRIMEGADIQIGGRRGGIDQCGALFNTRGTMFTFAGAFVALNELLDKKSRGWIGFGDSRQDPRAADALYDGLEAYGMIPEFLNRLTGILVFPSPTTDQLATIATRSVIPSFNRLLSAFGAGIEMSDTAVALMAEWALETRTYARGIKSIVSSLVEDIVFAERKGPVQFGADDVRRAIQMAGSRTE